MDAYSEDLRRKKIVEARQRGMPTNEVARAFSRWASPPSNVTRKRSGKGDL